MEGGDGRDVEAMFLASGMLQLQKELDRNRSGQRRLI